MLNEATSELLIQTLKKKGFLGFFCLWAEQLLWCSFWLWADTWPQSSQVCQNQSFGNMNLVKGWGVGIFITWVLPGQSDSDAWALFIFWDNGEEERVFVCLQLVFVLAHYGLDVSIRVDKSCRSINISLPAWFHDTSPCLCSYDGSDRRLLADDDPRRFLRGHLIGWSRAQWGHNHVSCSQCASQWNLY